MNTSGITPVEQNVIVRPKAVKEKTQGGLYLPDEHKDREQFAQMEGELIAVSPGAFRYNYPDFPEDARKPQVGDMVLFAKYQATEVRGRDGEKYWLMKDVSIAGIME